MNIANVHIHRKKETNPDVIFARCNVKGGCKCWSTNYQKSTCWANYKTLLTSENHISFCFSPVLLSKCKETFTKDMHILSKPTEHR